MLLPLKSKRFTKSQRLKKTATICVGLLTDQISLKPFFVLSLGGHFITLTQNSSQNSNITF